MTASATGWYGKLPALGDFASRRLPPGFISAWDDWLQRSLAASRRVLGERWLDRYLQSPVWRFLLGPGTCGDGAWAGVLMPSTDRVGRYFPLTIAAPVPWQGDALAQLVAAQAWFDTIEQAALSVLDVHFTPDALDRALPPHPPISGAVLPDEDAAALGEGLKRWWLAAGETSFDGVAPVGRGTLDLLTGAVMHAASSLMAGRTLWWHMQAGQPGRLFGTVALPGEMQFVSLLDDVTAIP